MATVQGLEVLASYEESNRWLWRRLLL